MRFFKMDNSTKRLFEVVIDDFDEVLSTKFGGLYSAGSNCIIPGRSRAQITCYHGAAVPWSMNK